MFVVAVLIFSDKQCMISRKRNAVCFRIACKYRQKLVTLWQSCGYLTSGSETAASQELQAQRDATQVTFVADEAVEQVTQTTVVSVHGNKEMGEMKVYLHSFSTSASDEGERSYSHPGKTGLSTDKI